MKRIGIDFSVKKSAGGAYQYCLAFLDALKDNLGENSYVIFDYSPDLPKEDYQDSFRIVTVKQHNSEKKEGFRLVPWIKEIIYRILLFFRLFFVIDIIFKYIYRRNLILIKENDIDIMLFPSGAQYAPYLKIPYITTIYDLEHRKHPEFPEVSKKGRWLSREYYYQNICKTASFILVDSEVGKQDVLNFYKINDGKVIVLPYLPPNYLQTDLSLEQTKEILEDFKLPKKFIFYPAQFWPHKNHLNLVKAIKILRTKDFFINLVLSGAKKEEWGEFKKVQEYIRENKLEDAVFYLGYIDNEQISALYKSAVAMVMPTFFGPTNIPVLEAWKMGCPVLYSDIIGCREQLGGAGLLIDPFDPYNIAEKIGLIWQADDNFRKDLIIKGEIRLSSWGYKDFSLKIGEIIKKVI